MQQPLFSDAEFIDATGLNNAVASLYANDTMTTDILFGAGVVNGSAASCTLAGYVATLSLPIPFAVLFGNGKLAYANGIVPGATSSTYTVDMTSFVPSSGSVVVYIVATSLQIGQTSYVVVGPPQGHPDYDPTFVPYSAYQTTQESLAVTATTTAPDNLTSIELYRTTLVAGATSVASVDPSHRVLAGSVLNQDTTLGDLNTTEASLSFKSLGSKSMNGYDVKMTVTGGTPGANGGGTLSLQASTVSSSGMFYVPNDTAAHGFAVGDLTQGTAAPFFANMAAGYGHYMIQLQIGGADVFHVDQLGNVIATGSVTSPSYKAGSSTVAGSPAFDFLTGKGNSYDARLIASQGQANTIGGGILSLLAASFLIPTPPSLDHSNKAATTAWAAGTFVPSDAPNGQFRGHLILPSGLIIQWGTDNTGESQGAYAGGGGNNYTFDIPFPNRCFGVIAQENNASGWNVSASPGGPAATLYGISGANQTSFNLFCAGFSVNSNGVVSLRYDSGAGFFFIALGY